MKFISELKEAEKVESVFAVTEKQLRVTRAGKSFISLKLSDKTGGIDAVVWDNAEATAAKFEKGDFIAVRADVNSYQGTLQLTVQGLKKVEKTGEYIARTLPVTEKDVEGMAAELRAVAGSIENPAVRELVMGFMDDRELMESFKGAPAAKGIHHAFSGGLMQHTLKVARLCVLIYNEYRETDPKIADMMSRDLLIAGAILHDIGKLQELSPGAGFDYTFKGRLLGHVSLGLMTLKEHLDKVEGLPEDAADLLMHMLISHHGEYEYGSPKRPKCMEAFILHYADNLDAKIQGLYELTEKDNTEGKFTAFNRLYERYFYKGRPFLGEGEEEQ